MTLVFAWSALDGATLSGHNRAAFKGIKSNRGKDVVQKIREG